MGFSVQLIIGPLLVIIWEVSIDGTSLAFPSSQTLLANPAIPQNISFVSNVSSKNENISNETFRTASSKLIRNEDPQTVTTGELLTNSSDVEPEQTANDNDVINQEIKGTSREVLKDDELKDDKELEDVHVLSNNNFVALSGNSTEKEEGKDLLDTSVSKEEASGASYSSSNKTASRDNLHSYSTEKITATDENLVETGIPQSIESRGGLNRNDKGRSLELDTKKYVSPEFYNKNSVYNTSSVQEVQRYLPFDTEKLMSEKDFKSEDEEDSESLFTTSTSKYSFDLYKDRENIKNLDSFHFNDSEQEISEINSPEQTLSDIFDTPINGSKAELVYSKFKNLQTKNSKNGTGTYKTQISETRTSINYQVSFNDTDSVEEETGDFREDKPYDSKEETEKSSIEKLNNFKDGDSSERDNSNEEDNSKENQAEQFLHNSTFKSPAFDLPVKPPVLNKNDSRVSLSRNKIQIENKHKTNKNKDLLPTYSNTGDITKENVSPYFVSNISKPIMISKRGKLNLTTENPSSIVSVPEEILTVANDIKENLLDTSKIQTNIKNTESTTPVETNLNTTLLSLAIKPEHVKDNPESSSEIVSFHTEEDVTNRMEEKLSSKEDVKLIKTSSIASNISETIEETAAENIDSLSTDVPVTTSIPFEGSTSSTENDVKSDVYETTKEVTTELEMIDLGTTETNVDTSTIRIESTTSLDKTTDFYQVETEKSTTEIDKIVMDPATTEEQQSTITDTISNIKDYTTSTTNQINDEWSTTTVSSFNLSEHTETVLNKSSEETLLKEPKVDKIDAAVKDAINEVLPPTQISTRRIITITSTSESEIETIRTSSEDENLTEILKSDHIYPNSPVNNSVSQKSITTITEDFTEGTTVAEDLQTGENMEDGGNGATVAAITISSIGALCLLLLAGLLFLIKRRHKRFNYGQRCTPVSLDSYSVDRISVYNSMRRKGIIRASKRSYGNPAFDNACFSHPLNFNALTKFTVNQEAITVEFDEIPQIAAQTHELPEGCDMKNRYANVIPLPETRVSLTPIDGYPNSDYINANYVTGPNDIKDYYIACQAPMQNTVDDFWKMVWEQKSKLILMLTHLYENHVEKCADYLPPSEVLDCHRLFGDFQVTLKKREVKEKYVISSLQLKNMVSNSWTDVTHMWYLGWPEKGVPTEVNSIIAFLIEARSYVKLPPSSEEGKISSMHGTKSHNGGGISPVVIHCSPGTGRTGTVIACDMAIREFELTRQVDIPKLVYRIRRDRAGAVQTKEQYALIYKVVSTYAVKLTGGVSLDNL